MQSSTRLDFAFLNAAHAFDHMLMLLYPTVVLALGTQFPGSYAELLSASVFGFVMFGAGALPAGWLGDRWSRKGMMVVFFVGIGAAIILVGLAQSVTQIAIALALAGLFASIYHPVGIAMVSEIADKRLGRALGINGVFGNLGIAFAAVVAGTLVDAFGWRWAFFVPGAAAIATGLLYAAWGTNLAPAPAQNQGAKPDAAARGKQRRVLTVMAIAAICGGLAFNSLTISMPKIFAVRLSEIVSSTAEIGAVVTVVVSIAAFAQIVAGHLVDRYPMRKILLGVGVLLILVLFAAGNAFGLPLVVLAVGAMMLVFSLIPLVDTVIARHTAPAWRARAYAVRYSLNLCVGATAVPLVAGLYELTGAFTAVFMTLAGVMTFIVAASMLLPRDRSVAASA